MKIILLQHCTTYFWHQIYETCSIIALINSGHACLFQKGFCMVYFRARRENEVTPPHSAQRKHAFWGEINEMSKTRKLPSRKKTGLELLHKILGHRYTISLLAGDNSNV